MNTRNSSHTGSRFADFPLLAGALACTLAMSGCKPASEPAAEPSPSAPAKAPTVSIPEEFLESSPTPAPKKPVLPRVVFATSDFQITTANGIKGIRAGEAMTFLSEVDGDYVLQYAGEQFRKNKSLFAATYAPSSDSPAATSAGTTNAFSSDAALLPGAGSEMPPDATQPAAPSTPDDAATADTIALPADPIPNLPLTGSSPTDPVLPGEPDSAPTPGNPAEAQKIDEVSDSIRSINNEIRSTQEEAARIPDATSAERKKSERAIRQLKEKRDALSTELTEMGKP